MKKCLNCGIKIGGNRTSCPLCQNAITGEGTVDNWPSMIKLKKQAFIYKLQLFLVLATVVVALSLDFLLDLYNDKHWSVVVTVAAITIEIVVRGFLKRNIVIAKIISMSVLHISLILLFASWYYDFMNPVIYFVIPILMGITLIVNLVFSLIDKTENAMVYLLVNILAGVLAYIAIALGRMNRTLPWTICLMISVITFIGIVIFKGRKVFSEIQKRMNF